MDYGLDCGALRILCIDFGNVNKLMAVVCEYLDGARLCCSLFFIWLFCVLQDEVLR